MCHRRLVITLALECVETKREDLMANEAMTSQLILAFEYMVVNSAPYIPVSLSAPIDK